MTGRAIRCRSRIEQTGVNPFVWITRGQVDEIARGRRGPVPVKVRVNGLPREAHRVNMMPTQQGRYRLYLNGAVRSASGTAVGDRVDLEIELDGEYLAGPTHPVPEALRAGLKADPRARATWDDLPPSRRKEILRYLGNLRGVDSRRRNIETALRVLGGGRERFLGREWNPETGPPGERRDPSRGRPRSSRTR